MLPFVISPNGTPPPTSGGITVGTGFASIWMASARPVGNTFIGEAQRGRQSTYARGLKERIIINCVGPSSWRWRRIVFVMKGVLLFDQPNDNLPWYDTGASANANMRRGIITMPDGQYTRVKNFLYDGAEGNDWNTEFTAKVDTSRVTLLSDKTRSFNPGNQNGTTRAYNLWTPFNKTLVYSDDEDGAPGNTTYYSTQSKAGMGDVYVYDVVQNFSTVAGSTFQFVPEATYYWHER